MALVIEVKVVPSSGKSACVRDKRGGIKCFLKSAPEQGKANAELVKLVAKIAGITSHDVEIIVGAMQRKKTIRMQTLLSQADFLARLNGDIQQKLFV